MSQIAPDIIEAIKEEATLERVLSELYGKEIKDSKTVCDFHDDSSPSLHIFPDGGYKCFACGAGKKGQELILPDGTKITDGGNSVFGYIMNKERVSFPQAVRILGDFVGIQVPYTEIDKETEQLMNKTTEQNRQFYAALVKDQDAMNYLASRGIDGNDIQKWRLGMVPWNWANRSYAGTIVFGMTEMFRKPEEARTIAMAYRIRNKEDYLKNGWMIDEMKDYLHASLDESGQIESLNPKYRNDKKSRAYDKSKYLYGMTYAYQALKGRPKDKRFMVLVEGYMDVIMAHKQGLDTTVGTCGTALTDGHADIIARNAKKVYLWFDGDTAGRNATLKALPKLLERGCDVMIVNSDGKDPAELVNEGVNLIQFIATNAKPAVQMLINQELEEYDRVISEKRTNSLRNLLPLLESIKDPASKANYQTVMETRLGVRL